MPVATSILNQVLQRKVFKVSACQQVMGLCPNQKTRTIELRSGRRRRLRVPPWPTQHLGEAMRIGSIIASWRSLLSPKNVEIDMSAMKSCCSCDPRGPVKKTLCRSQNPIPLAWTLRYARDPNFHWTLEWLLWIAFNFASQRFTARTYCVAPFPNRVPVLERFWFTVAMFWIKAWLHVVPWFTRLASPIAPSPATSTRSLVTPTMFIRNGSEWFSSMCPMSQLGLRSWKPH